MSQPFSEAWIEDRICEDVSAVLPSWTEHAAFVGRQVVLPMQKRLDLLAVSSSRRVFFQRILWVIEIKCDAVKIAAIGQVLTYVGLLREVLGEDIDFDVEGCIVGPGISREALYAARAAGVYYTPVDFKLVADPSNRPDDRHFTDVRAEAAGGFDYIKRLNEWRGLWDDAEVGAQCARFRASLVQIKR